MGTLTIRIDAQLEASLESLAKMRHQSKSEAARQMLRGGLLRESLRRSQEELGSMARATGWLTEDAVLRDVS